MIEPRNISNSEVTTWLSCKVQYGFAFMQNLAPKVTPHGLARGTLGHGCFEAYINARLNSSSHDKSMLAANEYLAAQMQDNSMDLILETKSLFERYMGFHQGWPEWELLGTEERLDMKLTDTLSFPIRYDLMIRDRATGKIKVGDFKFSYDFWSPDDHALNGQMPKYIAVMRHNGIEVHSGFLEEVRSRKLGPEKSADHKNLWRRTSYVPSLALQRNLLKQHIAASLEIEQFRTMTDAQKDAVSIPVLNKFGACKYCNFKDLCRSKLDGKTDLTYDIESSYVTNTYGYNNNLVDNEDLI